jgi:hypothetical protein
MRTSTLDLENPRAPKPPLKSAGNSAFGQGLSAAAREKELQRIKGMKIAQSAVQGIGMSTKEIRGSWMSTPNYALPVSLLFTRATNQRIMLGTEPDHVLSTSLLYNSLVHDSRFMQVPTSQAAPGDIVIQSGLSPDGYAGIVVDHGRIISESSKGVQNNSSLLEIGHRIPPMFLFRYIGVQKYPGYTLALLANAGFDPDEPRIPAGQSGGGQWTSGGGGNEVQNGKEQMEMAPSLTVSSGRNSLLSDEFGRQVTGQNVDRSSAEDNGQPGTGQVTGSGTGTKDQLGKALQELDDGYAKEVQDIENMSGITDKEKNAGLQSLEQKYQKTRTDLQNRIAKIEQLAEDMAFAYGGKASDYYKVLDDTDPKVQELMGDLDHLESYGFKDAFLLELRNAQGQKPLAPSDPHVLRSALGAGIGVIGEGEGAPESSAVEEAADGAKKAFQMLKNALDGAKRAAKTAEELAAENPGKSVQNEKMLRDADGKIVVDPVTGEGRRVDHVVIDQEAGTAKAYETTGDNVDKRLQQQKEERIRDAGGTYVRDKKTGKLIPIEGVSEVRRQK